MALFVIVLLVLVFVLWFSTPERNPAKHSGRRKRKALTDAHRAILGRYAIHYQRLGAGERARFEQIVSAFVHDKDWVGAGVEVALEMKVMIAACAAQLLLGSPEIEMMHFQRIIVYPGTYRSPRSGRMHQGEVRPRAGIIVISWDDFVHGYAHSRDAHNVGLHEMAHALWFENMIRDDGHAFLEPALLERWKTIATREVARIKARQAHYFRDYAGTNQAEFFAVAVEYFFEQPRSFKEALPDVYGTLSALLRQDPASLDARTLLSVTATVADWRRRAECRRCTTIAGAGTRSPPPSA